MHRDEAGAMPEAGAAGQGERGEDRDECGAQRRREEDAKVRRTMPSNLAATVTDGSGGERSEPPGKRSAQRPKGAEARGIAANENAPLSRRLDAEVGFGLPVFGGGFTGTPNVGMGLSDTARELRLGWRLSPADGGDFEFHLDAARREAVNDPGSGSGAGSRWAASPRCRR